MHDPSHVSCCRPRWLPAGLHSLNGFGCVTDSRNLTRCPTNFPSGPSFGATFDRELIREMANVVGTELRAVFKNQGANFQPSLDCWGYGHHGYGAAASLT